MKQLILLLVIAGAIGALFFMSENTDSTPGIISKKTAQKSKPAVLGKSLLADTTAGYVGVESPDKIVAQLDAFLAPFLTELKPIIPLKVMTFLEPKSRAAALGFEPATNEGWKRIGIDSAGGAFMGMDSVVMKSQRRPLVLLKTTDLKTLTTFISSKTGDIVMVGDTLESTSIIRVNKKPQFFVGKRGDYTAIMPIRGRNKSALERQRATFATYLSRTGPTVETRPNLVKATHGPTADGRLLGLLNTQVMFDVLNARRQKMDPIDQRYYAERFPAAGFVTGPSMLTARVVANKEGNATLEKLFKAPGKPNLTQHIPKKGWSASRFSINLKTLFLGIADMIPPSKEEARMMLPMAQVGFAAKMGFPYDNLANALSGHMLLAFDNKSYMNLPRAIGKMKMIFALGVNDTALTDQILTAISSMISSMPRGPGQATPVKIGESTGVQWAMGPLNIIMLRHEKTIFIATSAEAIKAAINLEVDDSLASTKYGRFLEASENVYAGFVDGKSWLQSTANSMVPALSDEQQKVAKRVLERIEKLGDMPFTVSLRLDEGLHLTVDGLGAVMGAVGASMAFVIPAFMKYTQRAKTSEATMNLRKAFDGSVAYYNEEMADRTGRILPRQFPNTVETPPHNEWHRQVCKDGRSQKFQPTASTWDAHTWQALNFAIEDPFYYKYTYISKGTGAGSHFTIRATGDLNCDGVFSTFERIGTVDAENNVSGPAGTFTMKELE